MTSTLANAIAYLNGQWIDAREARIPVWDAGFVLGATVTEQIRTFNGRLFRLDEHLRRLERSLQIVEIDRPASTQELSRISQQLVNHNHPLLPPGSDLGLAILVTPGPYSAFASPSVAGPTVCLHTYALPFSRFASKYLRGEFLVTTPVQQVPSACWPPELKCRSRMNYYLAEQMAARREPGARALLLNAAGDVTETATSNVLAWFPAEGLVSPPREQILEGITLAVVRELCGDLTIPFHERILTPTDLRKATEIMVTNTLSCILPVTRFNGQAVGNAQPGPIYARLLSAFGRMAGLDISQQAVAMSS